MPPGMTTACTGSAEFCENNKGNAACSRYNVDWHHLINTGFCYLEDAEYLVLLLCTHSSRHSGVT